jgi:hypothetical protein
MAVPNHPNALPLTALNPIDPSEVVGVKADEFGGIALLLKNGLQKILPSTIPGVSYLASRLLRYPKSYGIGYGDGVDCLFIGRKVENSRTYFLRDLLNGIVREV